MSNVAETSAEYVEGRDEFDEAAKRLLGVDVFLKIVGAGLDRREVCREIALKAFTYGLLDSPTQGSDLMLIRCVAHRVWGGTEWGSQGETGFDESEELQIRPRRLTTTPPVDWTRCTRVPTANKPQCVRSPRWSVHASCSTEEQACHFHPTSKAESHSLTAYVGHEPLSRDMHDALMEEVERCEWTQSSPDSAIYDCYGAKAKLQGYLEALVQVGCISANHPLCLLT